MTGQLLAAGHAVLCCGMMEGVRQQATGKDLDVLVLMLKLPSAAAAPGRHPSFAAAAPEAQAQHQEQEQVMRFMHPCLHTGWHMLLSTFVSIGWVQACCDRSDARQFHAVKEHNRHPST